MRRLVAHWWTEHPGVRSHNELTRGERAADRMRLGMGSWAFVFSAVAFLAVWMTANVLLATGAFDQYPFILLNLVLSCVAALQGAVLLIAAKRSDQISAEVAQHTADNTAAILETVTEIRDAVRDQAAGGGQ
jgi:uncharacterized membrane protein